MPLGVNGRLSCAGLLSEINLAAARLARRIADEFTALNPEKPRFVAGSVTYQQDLFHESGRKQPAFRALTFDELQAAYCEQMEALLEGEWMPCWLRLFWHAECQGGYSGSRIVDGKNRT